jgi:hypothetical protein
VFDRYDIVSSDDLSHAVRKLNAGRKLAATQHNGTNGR